MIVTMVLLNLFVAIIIQGFEEMQETEEQLINEKVMGNFRSKWAWHDKQGKGYIRISEFKHFLA
jgi:hypothetical protein